MFPVSLVVFKVAHFGTLFYVLFFVSQPVAANLKSDYGGNEAHSASTTNRTFVPAADDLKQFVLETCSFNAFSRPVVNFSSTVNVGILMIPFRLRELDEKAQRFTITAEVNFYWWHPCAKWNSSEWNGATELILKTRDHWYPKLKHTNADGEIALDSNFDAGITRIYNDGRVEVETIASFSSFCPMRFTTFPFDTQRCTVQFESQMRIDKVNVSLIYGGAATYFDEESPFTSTSDQWSLVELTSRATSDVFSKVTFTFVIERRYASYVISIFFPAICLVVVVLLSGLMPASTPDRPMFVITVVLVLTVLQSQVSESIPKTSEIAYVVAFLTVQIGVGILLTIFTLATCFLSSQKWFRSIKSVVICCGRRWSVATLLDACFYGGVTVATIVIDCILLGLMLTSK